MRRGEQDVFFFTDMGRVCVGTAELRRLRLTINTSNRVLLRMVRPAVCRLERGPRVPILLPRAFRRSPSRILPVTTLPRLSGRHTRSSSRRHNGPDKL